MLPEVSAPDSSRQERDHRRSARVAGHWSPEQYQQFLRNHTVAEYQGVLLCDLRRPAARASIEDWFVTNFRYPMTYNPQDSDRHFVPWTFFAIKLVEQYDERRFRRIQRYIDFIVNTECDSPANYSSVTRACKVDMRVFPYHERSPWYRILYAGILVHEATHGWIAARGIPYSEQYRLRIERLCHLEERRFLTKIDPWWAENAPRINEKWLKEYWRRWTRERRSERAP